MTVFNLKNVSKEERELTKENVLKKVSELQIFEYYFENRITLRESYTNPLRADSSPGCKFFIGRTNKLLFIDTSRQNSVRDCFGFVCDKYNCNLRMALQIINRDFKLGFEGEELGHLVYDFSQPTLDYFEEQKEEEKKLLCLKRAFRYADKKYWQQYGVDLMTLKKFNVIPIQTVFYDNRILWRNSEENPIYCYNFPNEKKKKIYRPLEKDKKYKFISSSGMGGIYQGFDQLPKKGDLLIITKSMKDVMTLHGFGYPAIAPNSENCSIPLDFYDNLLDRFREIILFYDNDEAGLLATSQISEDLDMSYILIPKQYGVKDISDFYKKYGPQDTETLLDELLYKPFR